MDTEHIWKEIHVTVTCFPWWTIIFGIHINFRGCDIPQNIAPARRPGTKRKAYTHYIANSWPPSRKKNLRMLLVGNNPLKWCWKKSCSFDGYRVIDFFLFGGWFFGGVPSRQNPGGESCGVSNNNTEPLRPQENSPQTVQGSSSKDFVVMIQGRVSSFLCEKPKEKILWVQVSDTTPLGIHHPAPEKK